MNTTIIISNIININIMSNRFNIYGSGGGNSLSGMGGNMSGSYTHPIGNGNSVIVGGNRNGQLFDNGASNTSGSIGFNHTGNGASTTVTGTLSRDPFGHSKGIIGINTTF